MKPLTLRDEEVLAVSKILDLRKQRTLLALQVLFEELKGDLIYKCYILEKIAAVSSLEEPEQILDPSSLRKFKRLFDKFLEEGKQW